MERLTKRTENGGIAYESNDFIVTCYPANNNLRPVDKMAERLAELEDKLESGLLLDLPCMVGREVYVVKKDKYGTPRMRYLTLSSYKVGAGNFVTVYFANQKKYVRGGYPDIEPERDCSMLGRFGKDWFTDIKQAEARLKELQGK